MDRRTIPVRRVLDQKDHQDRDDRRAGVDHQRPGIAESRPWAGDDPAEDGYQCQGETERMSRGMCPPRGELRTWRRMVLMTHRNLHRSTEVDRLRGAAIRTQAGCACGWGALALTRKSGSGRDIAGDAGWVATSWTISARLSAPADFNRYRPPAPVTARSSACSYIEASAIRRAPTRRAASIPWRSSSRRSWLRSSTRTSGCSWMIVSGEKVSPLTARNGERPR
jgi:hypothetical protein